MVHESDLIIYKMIKRMAALLFTVFFIGCQQDSDTENQQKLAFNTHQQSVRITTFNLKWFGLKRNGGYEFRSPYLKKFITQELGDTEVILFTEVVDWKLLQNILLTNWKCQNDDFKDGYPNQQHIVLCYDSNKFRLETYDHDYMIPEVAIKKPGKTKTGLRPAHHSQLCNLNGQCFLQIIGLHLKAGKFWHRRAKQMRMVRNELIRQPNPLPTLILGDMNSYSKNRKKCTSICIEPKADSQNCEIDSKKEFECSTDDIAVYNSILKEAHNRTYRSLTLKEKTFNSGSKAVAYDHLIVSSDIQARNIKAYAACAENIDPKATVIPYNSTFKKFFSDHCPVSATLIVRDKI